MNEKKGEPVFSIQDESSFCKWFDECSRSIERRMTLIDAPLSVEELQSYLAFVINNYNETRERWPVAYGEYYRGKEDAFRSIWVLVKAMRKSDE